MGLAATSQRLPEHGPEVLGRGRLEPDGLGEAVGIVDRVVRAVVFQGQRAGTRVRFPARCHFGFEQDPIVERDSYSEIRRRA